MGAWPLGWTGSVLQGRSLSRTSNGCLTTNFVTELLDGILVVSPAPGVWHQEVAGALYRLLYQACPPELCLHTRRPVSRRDRGLCVNDDM